MKLKKQMYKVIAATLLFAVSFAFAAEYVSLAFLAASYLLAGWPVVRKAFRNMSRGHLFDENFLMAVATFGAIALGQYSEAAGVMLFYQIGELFQSYAVAKSRRSISALMNIRPDYANVKRGKEICTVSPEDVLVGDVIVVKPGEKIPLDGGIVKGHSLVDTAAITGESVPRELVVGDMVDSGCVVVSGLLEIEVRKPYGESTVAKILNLVETSASKKAKTEQFITQFARYYTPIVVVAAVLLAVVPPLCGWGEWRDWVYRALTFLVISCPCALVISVPLSFFGGIGAASRYGILVKGGDYLQALADVKTIVFDKTGTLTKGTFHVVQVKSKGLPEDEVLELAAYAGVFSSHPVSLSVRTAFAADIEEQAVGEFMEIAGQGITATVRGRKVAVGNRMLMMAQGLEPENVALGGTISHVAVDGEYAGWIAIADEVKEDAATAVQELKKLGVQRTVMLSGDRKTAAEAVADIVGIDVVCSELLPQHKVEQLEALMNCYAGRLAYVGDGINDAPVLARADIGVAMGGVGTDAAVEAADVVLMTDEPMKLATAVKISRRTLNIVKQNIVFALGIKFAVLGMGALGMATMWEAVFADVGVSVIAILNALRVLYFKNKD